MNKSVIKVANLTKNYRLYNTNGERIRAMLGFFPHKPGTFSEHKALDNVNIDIARGEKVGIIGRNGAGKSTLLKLITGVIEPTSGSISVDGETQALLQIGTGFHPDFTGRQNVLAYLAQLGIIGREAESHVEQIIEFAELEEYIDQPVKTYSTGMAMRLMFSASTVIVPDILVIDEVLGVGDAYFAKKSYDRIKDLSSSRGTTVLLVSHDIYSTSQLCERMIWLDKGRVVADSDAETTIKAYETSIRLQEEARLRLKGLTLSLQNDEAEISTLSLEFKSLDGAPLAETVNFRKLELWIDGVLHQALPIDQANAAGEVDKMLFREASNWGKLTKLDDVPVLPLQNSGSVFHKGVCTFTIPDSDIKAEALEVRCEIQSGQAGKLSVMLNTNEGHVLGKVISWQADQWTTVHSAVQGSWEPLTPDKAFAMTETINRHGSNKMEVTGFAILNESGEDTVAIDHGKPFSFRIDYKVNDKTIDATPQIVIALHRDGLEITTIAVARGLDIHPKEQDTGSLGLQLLSCLLPNGQYNVTILIARQNYYDQHADQFFSINPGVYTCLAKFATFIVEGAPPEAAYVKYMTYGEWECNTRLCEDDDDKKITSAAKQ